MVSGGSAEGMHTHTDTHKRTCAHARTVEVVAHAIAPPILATVRVPRCRRTHLTFGVTKLVKESTGFVKNLFTVCHFGLPTKSVKSYISIVVIWITNYRKKLKGRTKNETK